APSRRRCTTRPTMAPYVSTVAWSVRPSAPTETSTPHAARLTEASTAFTVSFELADQRQHAGDGVFVVDAVDASDFDHFEPRRHFRTHHPIMASMDVALTVIVIHDLHLSRE